MPYIKKSVRESIDGEDYPPLTAGELNYVITKQVIDYVEENGVSYATLNEVVGVLECAKQEFIRRVVNHYEESKLGENGDVYPVSLLT